MEIYDSKYFFFNKRFQQALGIWPYESRVKKTLMCGFLVLIAIAVLVPQIARLKTFFGKDLEKTMENVVILLYIFGIYIKLFVAVFSEAQMKTMYESTAKNFQIYTDEVEKNILKEFSERGRFITIGYILYMGQALMIFISLPLTPVFLDIIMPGDQPRPRMSILNGDYFVDDDVYYYQIYLFDSIACAATVFIMVSTDPMYAATVEHCLGLFSICKYRLETFNKNPNVIKTSNPGNHRDDYAYYALKEAIILHKDILKYHEIMQASYSLYFLLEMGATMSSVTMNCVMILLKIHNPFELVRYTLVLIGIMGQLFYLSWPGQKLIDYSGDIYRNIYLNDWYASSLKCQNLLKFMTLRCTRPCTLSGGGLYVMNFINYAAILKTSASYITVFSSF